MYHTSNQNLQYSYFLNQQRNYQQKDTISPKQRKANTFLTNGLTREKEQNRTEK
jgi:hypothetical protein